MYKKKIEKREIKVIFVFSFVLVLIFSFNFSNMQTDEKNIEEINPMISALSPIFIDDTIPGSDWAWAVGQTWCTGSGTEGDPYLLEDLTIDGQGIISSILIENSYKYFRIENCTVFNSGTNTEDAGIRLDNVANGTITMNNCSNNYGGIYLESSSHNNIVGNIMDGLDDATGIGLILSHNNTIDNNNVKNKYQGIRLEMSSDNIILDNTVEKSSNFGILLLDGSNYNTFSGNIVKNSTNCDGIILFDSNNNTISKNTLYDNNWEGIDVAGGVDNVLSNNTIFNNGQSGITLWTNFGSGNSHENNITGNTIYNNTQHGIYLEDSDDNNISGNIVYNHTLSDIFLLSSDNNALTGNTVYDSKENGILLDASYSNVMSENLIFDNLLHGISLIGTYSDYNNITKNKIYHNNESGIYIGFDMWEADIWDNEIYDNTMHGIYLDSSGLAENYGNWIYDNKEFGIYCTSGSYNNLFYENVFVRNKKHVVDDGSGNLWNNTDIGNYWDNHTGPDANTDGIVDIQYNITGLATSIDYLPIAEDGAPTVTIVSPIAGDVFNASAPEFTITVTDDFLYSMWYTIDGGSTEYPFTSFSGTIDQSAWDALSDGNVTLTFYADDLPGNTGSDEVVIEKDTQAPVITINSPADEEVFGKTPPSFNITIVEPNLDTIWYTVDSNFTIIDSTLIWTINQTIWSAFPEGSVTITIFANDTLGHTSSEEVTITKNIPSKGIGLDPFTTSVLIFLISGVAIIGIITRMYHKKRIIS